MYWFADAIDHRGMVERKLKKNEFLQHFSQLAESICVAAGASAGMAAKCADDLVVAFCKHYGGANLYIPQGRTDADELAAEAYALWQAGKSREQIRVELACSAMYVSKLLRMERDRLSAIRRRQQEIATPSTSWHQVGTQWPFPRHASLPSDTNESGAPPEKAPG